MLKRIFISTLFVILVLSSTIYAQNWTRVDPGTPGPGKGGFGDSGNVEAFYMTTYGGYLYVGTSNEDTGGEVWQYDGSTWIQANMDGFGDSNNLEAHGLVVYDNKLYAATDNEETGAEVWAYNGSTWTQVDNGWGGDANNTTARAMAVYNGNLYAGTNKEGFPASGGTEVWRYNGSTWIQVNIDGFGNANNGESIGIAVYKGMLYVGTSKEDTLETSAEVWRTAAVGGPPFTDWEQVDNGWAGDANNVIAHNLVVYNDLLFVATVNLSTGAEVWSYNGTTWRQVNTDGFGDANNLGATGMAVFNGNLYGGTWNEATGGQVWQNNGTKWTRVDNGWAGDANNIVAIEITVYKGRLYVGTSNRVTGAEIWRYTESTDLTVAAQPMVAAGYKHTVGLKSDGTVVAVGSN